MTNQARFRPLLLPRALPYDGRRIVTSNPYGARAFAMGRIPAFELACACVSDNDNVPSRRADVRLLLGIVMAGPLLGCLGVAAMLIGMSPG